MKKTVRSFLFYFLTILLVLFVSFGSSKAITVISENAALVREHCIIIDPGHGGEDGGATSCSGILESQFNLEISQRLNDLLQLLGFETKMIRDSDISIYTKGDSIAQKKVSDLKERVRIANEASNSLLLSIHQNNFTDSRYSGAQVFYAHNPDSKILAEALQRNFVTLLNPGSHRQEKKSTGVYLMDRVQCPAVLIECGFLSNPEEEAKLRDAEYQKKICCLIAATLSDNISNT